jgi:hypothetical protein
MNDMLLKFSPTRCRFGATDKTGAPGSVVTSNRSSSIPLPMIRAADDFEAIRARRDELCREQDAAIGGEPDPLPAEWLTPEAAERRQCHQRFTAQQTDELAKFLGPCGESIHSDNHLL